MSRTTKLIAGLLVSLSLWGASSSGAHAMPMGPAQEAIIRKGAVQAQQAVDAYADKRDRDAYDLFLDLADKLAVDVANFLGVDVNELRYAWRTADVAHQRAIMAGLTQIGVPYKENAAAESGAFDCSGFVQFAWSSAGFVLPRGSNFQYANSRRVPIKNAQAQYGFANPWLDSFRRSNCVTLICELDRRHRAVTAHHDQCVAQ